MPPEGTGNEFNIADKNCSIQHSSQYYLLNKLIDGENSSISPTPGYQRSCPADCREDGASEAAAVFLCSCEIAYGGR